MLISACTPLQSICYHKHYTTATNPFGGACIFSPDHSLCCAVCDARVLLLVVQGWFHTSQHHPETLRCPMGYAGVCLSVSCHPHSSTVSRTPTQSLTPRSRCLLQARIITTSNTCTPKASSHMAEAQRTAEGMVVTVCGELTGCRQLHTRPTTNAPPPKQTLAVCAW